MSGWDRFLNRLLLHPLWWLCRWTGHKDEHVPAVVIRGIDPTFDYKPTWMCLRCGRFRVEGDPV